MVRNVLPFLFVLTIVNSYGKIFFFTATFTVSERFRDQREPEQPGGHTGSAGEGVQSVPGAVSLQLLGLGPQQHPPLQQ